MALCAGRALGSGQLELGQASLEELPRLQALLAGCAVGIRGVGAQEDMPLVLAEVQGLDDCLQLARSRDGDSLIEDPGYTSVRSAA